MSWMSVAASPSCSPITGTGIYEWCSPMRWIRTIFTWCRRKNSVIGSGSGRLGRHSLGMIFNKDIRVRFGNKQVIHVAAGAIQVVTSDGLLLEGHYYRLRYKLTLSFPQMSGWKKCHKITTAFCFLHLKTDHPPIAFCSNKKKPFVWIWRTYHTPESIIL